VMARIAGEIHGQAGAAAGGTTPSAAR